MKNSLNNHLLSISWLFFLIFPNNNVFFVLVPIIYLSLFDKKKKTDKTTINFILLIVSLFVASFVFNLNEFHIDFKSIARAAVLILMFFTFGSLKGIKILAPYIVIAVLFLVISQFSGVLNFSSINSLIDKFYISAEGDSALDASSSFEMDFYGVQRLGGIFFNSNNFASYLGLIFAILLCEIKQFRKEVLIFLIPLIVFSLIATGSRTSTIVLTVMILFYLYTSKVFSIKRIALFSFFIIIIIAVTFLNNDFSDFRAFKIEEGLDNSFGVKIGILKSYLNSEVPIQKLLFGNFSGYGIVKYTGINYPGTDFEVGDLIVKYGLLFFITILLFYIYLFKKILPKYRVVFIILLWMFSNSILMSYRMSAVWMLVLGLYYHRSTVEKSKLQKNNI